jgi:hypothetical protein
MDFVDIYNVEVDNVEMETIKSISVTSTNTKNPVETMNRDRVAKGVTQGIQKFSAKITAARQLSNPEQDWHAWRSGKVAKNISYEMGDGGTRISLIDCYVNSVDEKADDNGEIMWDIDIVFLRREED